MSFHVAVHQAIDHLLLELQIVVDADQELLSGCVHARVSGGGDICPAVGDQIDPVVALANRAHGGPVSFVGTRVADVCGELEALPGGGKGIEATAELLRAGARGHDHG